MSEVKKRLVKCVYLKSDEIKKFLDPQLYANDPTGQRGHILFRLLLATGCRISEILGIDKEDVDLNARRILVQGKRSKRRPVFVDPDTAEEFAQYLKNTPPGGRAFDLSRFYCVKMVKKYARKAGIANWRQLSPHKLRHSFAIRWVQSKKEIEALRRLLGHARLNTTQVYLDYDESFVKQEYDR